LAAVGAAREPRGTLSKTRRRRGKTGGASAVGGGALEGEDVGEGWPKTER
jgi:hypothetical protein